jgi:hypothetical protein
MEVEVFVFAVDIDSCFTTFFLVFENKKAPDLPAPLLVSFASHWRSRSFLLVSFPLLLFEFAFPASTLLPFQ